MPSWNEAAGRRAAVVSETQSGAAGVGDPAYEIFMNIELPRQDSNL